MGLKNIAEKKAAAKPRISVNKLAEYLEAIPTRRKKIVEDAKYPEKFIVTRYKDARDIITGFLSGEMDEDAVLESIDSLNDKESETEFQEQDNRLSAESLDSLLETNISILEDCTVEPFDGDNELVEISGVDISVNPDLIVTKMVNDELHFGAIKLHISKTNNLSDESQKIVAVLLYLFADKFIKGAGDKASLKLCFSFDVFKQSLESCPTSFKHRLKKIEAACEEIALWWDKL